MRTAVLLCLAEVVAVVGAASGAAVVVSVVAGVSVVVDGVASVAGGEDVVGTAWGSACGTCWANKGVEESAKAAAIAGRALVRA